MKLLSQHIEYLMLRKECVILPGVGAFIATRRAAEINTISGTMLAPTREISFNADVRTDDGMLAHSVARKLQCSFEEGRTVVAREIDSLLQNINSRGFVEIDNIGTLRLSADECIQFEPRYSLARLQALWGLGNVNLNTLQSASNVSEMSETNERVESNTDSRYYVIRIPKRMARVAASLLLTIGVCLSVLLPSANRDSDRQLASVIPTVAINEDKPSVMPVETTASANEPLKASVSESDEEKASATEESKSVYYLVVGTFATEAGARRFAESNTDSNLEVYGSHTGIWRVAAGISTDRNQLQSQMNGEGFLDRYPGSWIWERK